MATKRMFAQEIISDQLFTDMSSSAQALYFHLGMLADDDGFVNNPKEAQNRSHSSDDDLRVLMAKEFVLEIRNGLVVITDWKTNNYIQKDRYKPTRYQEEKESLILVNGRYQFKAMNLLEDSGYNNSCIQNVSTDKNRKEENRLDENRNEINKNMPVGIEDDSFNPDDELPFL